MVSDLQLHMLLSHVVVTGPFTPKTLQLRGQIQNKNILILVDFDNTHSFLSSRISAFLRGVTNIATDIKVAVANGGSLLCQ